MTDQAASTETTSQVDTKAASDTSATQTAVAQAASTSETLAATTEAKIAATEVKTAEQTTTTGEKSAVPEKYELKIPEGSNLKTADIEKVSSYAKENKLSNEQAQDLLVKRSEAVGDYVQSQKTELTTRVEAWVGDIKSDKELGGDNYLQSVEQAKRVVDKFATDAFKKTLTDTGLGNHPELVRVFARIGKVMSDDTLVKAGNIGNGKKSAEEIIYGSPNQQS